MKIGRLRHRFSLQAPSGTSGYDEQATTRGSLEPTNASEALRYGVQTAQATWKIGLRYRTDVKGDWRLVERDEQRTFQITGLLPEKAEGTLIVFAIEGPQ